MAFSEEEGIKQALEDYQRHYGDEVFGVANLAAQRLKEAVMCDEDIAHSYPNWDAYTQSYCSSGDVPEHAGDDLWPVMLSQDDYETLQDGWHRLHSYLRAGHQTIPAVFSPCDRHLAQ